MDEPALIGLDWGSSRLRAYLLSRDGAVLDVRSSDAGASRLAVGVASDERAALFERQLRELVGDWLAPRRPIIACGMVGSAHGWREAAYCNARGLERSPSPPHPRARQRRPRAPDHSGRLVPAGRPRSRRHARRGDPGPRRARATSGRAAGASIVLPGTHSKWVRMGDGRIVSFATRMTGELFDVLRSHSLLARSLEDPGGSLDRSAFAQGLAASRDARGGDLSHLCSAPAAWG